jgi:hypothetical protein
VAQRDRHSDPAPDPAAILLNVLLPPQQSVVTMRVYTISAGAQVLGLVVTHEGGFQMEWPIIGGGPFHKPTRLDTVKVSGQTICNPTEISFV